MQVYIGRVTQNRTVALDTYLMELQGECGDAFVPGQFVHIEVPNRPDLILRRPISVHAYDARNKQISLVYQVVGEGTRAFANLKTGDAVSVLGPVGNGFSLPDGAKRCILVGGGIGCAPLLTLPNMWPDVRFDAALGFRSMAHIYARLSFEDSCRHVIFTTDDGSYGRKGLVTEALKTLLEEPCDAIFACGPKPMLRGLQQMIGQYGIPCFASLEERMGCGMGACVTCTCGIRVEGSVKNLRVCKDGPVFPLSEVVF